MGRGFGGVEVQDSGGPGFGFRFGSLVCKLEKLFGLTYLWLVENGRMVLVVIVVIIVPHSSIPY